MSGLTSVVTEVVCWSEEWKHIQFILQPIKHIEVFLYLYAYSWWGRAPLMLYVFYGNWHVHYFSYTLARLRQQLWLNPSLIHRLQECKWISSTVWKSIEEMGESMGLVQKRRSFLVSISKGTTLRNNASFCHRNRPIKQVPCPSNSY